MTDVNATIDPRDVPCPACAANSNDPCHGLRPNLVHQERFSRASDEMRKQLGEQGFARYLYSISLKP